MILIDVILLTVIITLTIVSICGEIIVNKIIIEEYVKSGSAAHALYKPRWLQIMLIVNTFAIWGLFGYYIWKQLWNGAGFVYELYNSELKEFIYFAIAAFLSMVYSLLVVVSGHSIHYKTYKTVRNLDINRIDHMLLSLTYGLSLLLPTLFIAMFVFFREFLMSIMPEFSFEPENIIIREIWFRLRIIVPILILAKIIDILPYLFKFFKKSRTSEYKEIANVEIVKLINEILNYHNLKRVKVYEFASKKFKYANALVFKKFTETILISDYLLENVTKEEFKAIFLHEIAHIKYGHLSYFNFIKNIIIAYLPPYIIWMVGFGFSRFALEHIVEGSTLYWIIGGLVISLGIIIYIIFTLYIPLFKLPAISRKNEIEADEFVLRNGVETHVLISALQKLTSLNDEPNILGKLEKIFTHPSLENRIKYINEFAKSMGS